MERFYHPKPCIWNWPFWLRLSIWVLIVSQHDQYVDCAVLVALSPPAFRFAIWQVFVESRSKTRRFRLKSPIISQPLNEYQSDRKSESGRWKSEYDCTIYVLIMLWYDQNSKTQLEPKEWEPYIWNCGPVPTQPNTCSSKSGLGNKPTKTQRVRFSAGSGTEPNRTAGQNPDHWRVTRTRC